MLIYHMLFYKICSILCSIIHLKCMSNYLSKYYKKSENL